MFNPDKLLSNLVLFQSDPPNYERNKMLITPRDKTQSIPKADPEHIAKKRQIVKRNKAQGRHIQSKMAKRLGGKSVGTIEGQDIAFSDKPWSIEVKHRKKFLGNTFMQQAIKNAPKDKTPIVIVHELNQRFHNSLVMIRLKDWEAWYGEIYKRPEES